MAEESIAPVLGLGAIGFDINFLTPGTYLRSLIPFDNPATLVTTSSIAQLWDPTITTRDKRQLTADQISATIDRETAQARLAKPPMETIPLATPLPADSSLPFAPNPFFTGRQDELKTLAAALKGGAGGGKTVVIGKLGWSH